MGILTRSAIALTALAAAGCYSPAIQNGSILCSDETGCPEGHSCIQGACWRDGTGPDGVDPDADPNAPDADPNACVDTAATAMTIDWANQVGGAGLEESYKLDARDTRVATGGDFDSNPFATGGPELTPVGTFDAFVVQYNDDQSHGWTRHILPQTGGDKYLATRDVAIDSGGGVITTGYFESRTNFGGTSVNSSLYSVFIARYDTSGNLDWVTPFISDFGFDTEGLAIAVNADDEVFVTGRFDEIVDFGGTNETPDEQDAFVVKLSPAGAYQWHAVFGGAGSQQGAGIATGGDGHPIVVGTFVNEIAFPDEPLEAGVEDGWVAKLDKSTGAVIWRKLYQGSGQDTVEDVATIGEDVYLCGTFASDLMVDTRGLTSGGSSGWLARLDGDGQVAWAREIGSSLNTSCQGVAADAQGPIVAGDFTGTLAMGDGAVASTADAYVAAFDEDGCATSFAHFPGSDGQAENGLDVAAAASGIYTTGTFVATMSFGATDLTATGTALDIYVAKLARP